MRALDYRTEPRAARARRAGTLVLTLGIVCLVGTGAWADPHPNQSVNVAIIDSPNVINGGYFPTSGGDLDDFTFTNLAVGAVNATSLLAFDTVLLNVASSGLYCSTDPLTADQKADLVDFVFAGGKLIIYDSECPTADYSWLPYPFTTDNPGAWGATGTLNIAENNVLSSTDPGDPHYIDAAAIATQTDAVGDMNVMTTRDPAWCLDMEGTNVNTVTGPVHTYARYGNGFIIYNGFDVDEMPSYDVPNGITKVWIQELQAPFNPSPEPDLPCGILVVGEPPRLDATRKGSLLIYPKVEIRWDTAGNLIQDTYIDIANDYPGSVLVQMYFANGDPPLAATANDREHEGWNWVDNLIMLTGNQPTYWSAATGVPEGVSPFTALDPSADPLLQGRPANDGTTDRVLRGVVLAWAVNAENEEIHWNHLKGDATIIHYGYSAAWEYNAYAAQALNIQDGERNGTPGELHLDGAEYEICPDLLVMDFYAVGADALHGGDDVSVVTDTDLTLLPMWLDLRQEHEGPYPTKAKFDIWNMNEVKFSGTERCITAWDQALLSTYDAPNHFLVANLQTNKGKARIDGMASEVVCGRESVALPLLGLAAKILDFNNGADTGMAGVNLIGMGREEGRILYDVLFEPPPELALPERPAAAPLPLKPVGSVAAPTLRGAR